MNAAEPQQIGTRPNVKIGTAPNKMPAGMRPRDGQEFRTHDGVNIVVRACFRNHFAGAIGNLKHRFQDGRLQQHPCRI
jgi:hypothetical protein